MIVLRNINRQSYRHRAATRDALIHSSFVSGLHQFSRQSIVLKVGSVEHAANATCVGIHVGVVLARNLCVAPFRRHGRVTFGRVIHVRCVLERPRHKTADVNHLLELALSLSQLDQQSLQHVDVGCRRLTRRVVWRLVGPRTQIEEKSTFRNEIVEIGCGRYCGCFKVYLSVTVICWCD
jgi:hypothetical protein